MKKNMQYAVLGLGKFGCSIVKTLTENGCDVLACDIDPMVVQDVSEFATHVVQVDISDEHALNTLGLGNFDVVIVAVGSDLKASLAASLFAKEKGAGYVYAKALDVRQKEILEKLGVDRVLMPETEMGNRFACKLVTSNLIDYINLSDKITIAEIEALPEWQGLTLAKSNIRKNFGFSVIMIKRGKKTITSPSPDEIVDEDDILVVVGELSDISKLGSRSKMGFLD